MTVLVTGGAGYIGSHMVLCLLDAGERVVVLDDLSTGFRKALPAEVDFVLGDAGDCELVEKIMKARDVEAVVHFAAKTSAPESVADPLTYYRTNFSGSASLVKAAVRARVRHILFSSTAAVYGQPEQSPVSESAPTRPINPYGRSKLMAENMLQDAAQAHGVSYAALRYFNVAGADPAGRAGQSTADAGNVMKAAIQAALGLRPFFELFGSDYPTRDGTCVRDFVQVTDLVNAHRAALNHLRSGGANLILNCGYGRGYSVREVVDAVQRVTGAAIPLREANRRPGDPAEVVACSALLHETLRWRPQFEELDEMVRQAVAWERKLAS